MREEVDIENVDHEEELEKQRREETKIKVSHEAGNKKVVKKYDKKETEGKENKILNEAIRDNIVLRSKNAKLRVL